MALETTAAGMAQPAEDQAFKKTMIGGAFSLTLADILSQAINYSIHIGLGRFFTPADYGYFGIIVSTLALLQVMLRWGLPRSVSYYVARDSSVAGDVLKKCLGLQTVYSLICFLVFFWFADRLALILGDPGLSGYLRFSAPFVLTFAFLPIYTGLLNGLGAFGKHAMLLVVRNLTTLLLVMGLLAAGMGMYGVIVAYILSPLAATGYALFTVPAIPRTEKKQVELNKIIAFGFPVFISSLAVSLLMRVDLFMVQSLLSDRVLTGLYTAASALIRAPYFLTMGAGLVLFRVTAHLKARSPAEVREFISKAMRYYVVGLVPIPFILAGTAEETLRIVFGSRYLGAAPVFGVLCFCFVFMILYNAITTFIAGLNRPRHAMILSLALLPAQVLLIYGLIWSRGLIGVALATTLSWFAGTVVGGYYLVRKGCLTLPGWRTLLHVALGSGGAYLLALWIAPQGVWLLLFDLLVYLSYLAFLKWTGEIGDSEVRALAAALSFSKSRDSKA